jgi:organic hydroperoxide reductase OsmC/OhrA
MMEYTSKIVWHRNGAMFGDHRYSRKHTWLFDGGLEVPASSSPHIVPVPMSDAAGIDPEEAFVASVASCHMLWFLGIAAKRGYIVDSYIDDSIGLMAKNSADKLAITLVTLRPKVTFSGAQQPNHVEIQTLHQRAHEECFIASSIKSEVRCEPVYA